MHCELEYLGEGELHVQGVGTFGIKRFDRKAKKQVCITKLPCTEEVARVFDADRRDKRFKVHGLGRGVSQYDPTIKKTEKGGK